MPNSTGSRATPTTAGCCSYSRNLLRSVLPNTWMNVKGMNDDMPLTFEARGDFSLSNCGIYGSTEYNAELSIVQGRVFVQTAVPDDDEAAMDFDPDITAEFTLDDQNQLRGGYYLRQPRNQESRGQITLGAQAQELEMDEE